METPGSNEFDEAYARVSGDDQVGRPRLGLRYEFEDYDYFEVTE